MLDLLAASVALENQHNAHACRPGPVSVSDVRVAMTSSQWRRKSARDIIVRAVGILLQLETLATALSDLPDAEALPAAEITGKSSSDCFTWRANWDTGTEKNGKNGKRTKRKRITGKWSKTKPNCNKKMEKRTNEKPSYTCGTLVTCVNQ